MAGERYYAHPENVLYDKHRVLKLHGSIDWLRYSQLRTVPAEFLLPEPDEPSLETILQHPGLWWNAQPPRSHPRYLEPLIVPPQLYKQYDSKPLPDVWAKALESLSTCRVLIVIGYSFPPTDFRMQRLFIESFAEGHRLDRLVVVNPDPNVVSTVRRLTNHTGPWKHKMGSTVITECHRLLFPPSNEPLW